ncbi:MAG: type 1 glutamine amidotransferase [Rhizobiaceae bacterium]|nr:type 1 glutamine amidotransferase [Rhizobiaceae bacterium]
MKIGILQCGHLEESLEKKHGGFFDMFSILLAGQGFVFENYLVVDNQFPSGVGECDGWLVTGSLHGAYEEHVWIAPLEEFIRQSYAANVPITGICFGHQIMAQALGGKVIKFPGGWGIGHGEYAMAGVADPVELLALHQDQIVEVPPQARVIATSEFCANAALAYQGSALSYQPHPEFTVEFMRDLIRHKISKGLSSEIGEAALSRIESENDSALIALQLADFYKKYAHAMPKSQAAE